MPLSLKKRERVGVRVSACSIPEIQPKALVEISLSI
jgi:hypothetical protein